MFGRKCSVIGVVHVLPLPGSPGWQGNMKEVIDGAIKDALAYKDGGVDALIVENMHDVPYLRGRVEPETTAAMTAVAREIKYEVTMPVGIQILSGANLEALGAAIAAELDFLRVEGFVFAHVGDEGIHESCAAQLLRRRAALKAEKILVFADIKKKHSAHAITADVTLAETARAAEFFGADGVIVTGVATGEPTDVADVEAACAATTKPVMVGSGITPDNVSHYLPYCDAVIVGSYCKQDGCWRNKVDPQRVKELMARVAAGG